MDGPGEVLIDGATSYWLGDRTGAARGAESERTGAPFTQALDEVRNGTDPESLVVWARLRDGQRYRVAGGTALVALAERSAGIRTRPRVLKA